MFLQNTLEPFRSDARIPNAVGINDKPRPIGADAETLRLCAHDLKIEIFDPLFDVIPSLLALIWRTTVRSEAQEEVLARVVKPGLLKSFLDLGAIHINQPLPVSKVYQKYYESCARKVSSGLRPSVFDTTARSECSAFGMCCRKLVFPFASPKKP